MAKTKKVEESVEAESSSKDAKMGVYEIGYIMVPTIAEENLGEEVTSLKDMLGEKEVSFISDEYPRMIELSYEMSRSIANKKQKFSYGYFGWVKFECTTDDAKAIKDALDKNEKLVRYLMIKTVRENTMSPKRSYSKDGSGKRRVQAKPEEVTPINEEEVDKEIDALVV